jgi:hypothetical protein
VCSVGKVIGSSWNCGYAGLLARRWYCCVVDSGRFTIFRVGHSDLWRVRGRFNTAVVSGLATVQLAYETFHMLQQR